MNTFAKRFNGNVQAQMLFRFPCPQRVLVVTDGSLNFGAGGFGLSEFVGILQAAGHNVSTAHRSGTGPNLSIPGAFNFASAATAVTLANYDQVWLFGFSTTPLSSAPAGNEQGVLAQFMLNGGGVFATGDHASIGAGMGLQLPRVRQMRNWASVPMFDPNRHDTVLQPGADGVKQFDDQADAVAQPMYPVFFQTGGPANQAASWQVHPVLRHPSGAVDALPDHAHESECFAPTPVAGNFAGVEEWPAPAGGGARIAPVVVGVTMSAGRFITDTLKPPVLPHSFGAISAYDGDAAKVGRIVCDATWHHFVNINLNGSGGLADSLGNPRQGLYAGGAITPEYAKIRSYYLNTVRWLAPKGRRNCWPWLVSAAARFDFELAELQLPQPHPCPWETLVHIGQVAEGALERAWGPGASFEVVADLLAGAKVGATLTTLLTPTAQMPRIDTKRPATAQDTDAALSLLPVAALRRAMLGSLVNLLAAKLPEDPDALEKLLRDGHDRLVSATLPEALADAELSIADYAKRALAVNTRQLKTIIERK